MEPRDYRWRDVSPDYYGRLQQFECAKGENEFFLGAVHKHGLYFKEWELEVQSLIRNFHKPNPSKEWAHLCVKTGTARKPEVIYSFVWFGIVGGKKTDSEGVYTIGYIARSLEAFDCHFGDMTLRHAITIIEEDCSKTGRDPFIGTEINTHNQASIKLFSRNGFDDMGETENDPSYHRWVRIGF
jgi:ribosomal protein S18 acetylase RimI-like enzyme